jgi:DNA-binding response OmpR family regulator
VKQEYSVQKIHNYKAFIWFNFAWFDLILLDISLWDWNGFDILTELKENSLTQNIKVIVISGHGETDYKVKWLNLWADDYIVKPFSSEELIARIRANTRNKNLFQNTWLLEIWDIQFNTNTRNVLVAGKEVIFSKKEKALLEFFIQNSWKLISKQEISQRFWKNKNSNPSDNIINVTLHNFRKKIWSSVQIITQNGEWYIFSIK